MSEEEVPVPTTLVPINDEITAEIRNSWIYVYNPAVEYSEEELDAVVQFEVNSLLMTRRNFAQYVV